MSAAVYRKVPIKSNLFDQDHASPCTFVHGVSVGYLVGSKLPWGALRLSQLQPRLFESSFSHIPQITADAQHDDAYDRDSQGDQHHRHAIVSSGDRFHDRPL